MLTSALDNKYLVHSTLPQTKTIFICQSLISVPPRDTPPPKKKKKKKKEERIMAAGKGLSQYIGWSIDIISFHLYLVLGILKSSALFGCDWL